MSKWQMVPVEPTEEMCEAMANSRLGVYDLMETMARMYRAALAAAPPTEPWGVGTTAATDRGDVATGDQRTAYAELLRRLRRPVPFSYSEIVALLARLTAQEPATPAPAAPRGWDDQQIENLLDALYVEASNMPDAPLGHLIGNAYRCLKALVAQGIEQPFPGRQVAGSNPAECAKPSPMEITPGERVIPPD